MKEFTEELNKIGVRHHDSEYDDVLKSTAVSGHMPRLMTIRDEASNCGSPLPDLSFPLLDLTTVIADR